MNNYFKLEDVADVKLSNVDKKVKTGEKEIRLCNYTDVYKNTYIDKNRAVNFMIASCNEKEFEKFLLKKGQVSITKDSEKANDIGVSTYIEEDFQDVVLGYHLALITPYKEKLDGKYLNYWFNTSQAKRYFENNVGGSGQRFTLPLDVILSTPLCLPNIEKQKKISSILFSLDKKIQLLHQINDNLAELSKTIYDYWFVKFDFPDENGKPYKSNGGKMVYNEVLKREIPEGWEAEKLKKYAFIKKGTLITEKQANTNGNIKVVSAGLDFSYYHDKSNFLENTITISASGANAGFINFWREPIFACDCTTVRGNNLTETLYIYQFLKILQDYIYQQAKGSAQPHIYPKDIEDLNIIIPNENEIKKYGEYVNDLNQKILLNLKEIQHLQSLRDWLLPMLMNGQISVE